MKLTNDKLNILNRINKEWIVTNGIGGYSSSTVVGINTRKYHGLLVAPLSPPGRRHLILSKLDETIEIDGENYNMFSNMSNNYISHGFKFQTSFEKEYMPVFKYEINGIEITKIVCMEYGKNTVAVYYKVRNIDANTKLKLAPIINLRDFHSMNTGFEYNLKQMINNNKVKIVVNDNSYTPIYINLSEGKYLEHNNDTFKDMFYIEEEKRGFYPQENHAVSGVYEVDILPREEKEISFICSLEENIEEKNAKDIINNEIKRLHDIFNESLLIDVRKTKKTKKEKDRDELVRTYLIASDNFVVYRPSTALHTLIAGYHWFLDWGRDSLIAYEGLLLIPKRYEIARDILLTMIRDIKYGLIPNGYSGYDNRPLYNSVDAALLLFEQVQKYINYTGDYKFIKQNIFHRLEEIIERYCQGIDVDNNNIYLDKDGLISSGTDDTQNTWMDAKYDGKAVTPRNGKAVEINALWYNANKIMEELTVKCGNPKKSYRYKELAGNCKREFEKQFYNSENKCLNDTVKDSKIRPNQLFALSLTYPVIDPNSKIADEILETVREKLLNPFGLKTLAEGEENYVEVYEGDGEKRDNSYHQGITWPWLLGLYYNSLKNCIKLKKSRIRKKELQEELEEFITDVENTFIKEIYENGCIGSIAEIYDSKAPQLPKGTIAQAWSVAEVFRIILRR